jgi:hypothetical protein
MHYLPLAPGFFAILVGFFVIVLILRSVRYAYESLGVSSNTAIFLLLATLIGSFFNIPITELPPHIPDRHSCRAAGESIRAAARCAGWIAPEKPHAQPQAPSFAPCGPGGSSPHARSTAKRLRSPSEQ